MKNWVLTMVLQEQQDAMNDKGEEKPYAISYLEGFLGTPLDPETVTSNYAYYNDKYQDIAKAYGYDSFEAMYKYCLDNNHSFDFITKATAANDEAVASSGKSKEKDTSKLVLATKPTIRNGKPYTAPFWVDPNKADKSDKEKVTDNPSINATAVDGLYIGGDKFGKPLQTTKDNSKPPETWSIVGNYKKSCFDFIYAIDNGMITFMSGLTKDSDDIIRIQYASASDDKKMLSEIHTLLSKVIKEAWLGKYGVEFDPKMFDKYQTIVPFCETFQLNKRQGKYQLKPKQLQKVLGDSTCFQIYP